jgi:hypothetical protein
MAETNSITAEQTTNHTAPTGINWGIDEVGFVLGFLSKSLMDLSREGVTLGGGDCVGLGLILESCKSAFKEAA